MKRSERFILYKTLRDQGKGYVEISQIIGINSNTVGKYCRAHGLGYTEEERTIFEGHKTDEMWSDKLRVLFGDNVELIELGEVNARGERSLTVRCTTCGSVQRIMSTTLRKKHITWRCDECRILKREADRIRKEKEKAAEKLAIARMRYDLLVQAEFPTCKCGALAPMGHRICEDCRKENERLYRRERDRKKETIRRKRCAGGDWSITLKELFQRDDGVCHICGKPCDWEDYREESGAFIAGNDYPSIDHVIPLSRGGAHEWSNVRLAHFICNSIKSDSIAAPVKND